MRALTVIPHIVVTPAMVIDTNVPQNDHPEWAAAATYVVGGLVIVGAEHKVYRSQLDANTGRSPVTDRTAWQEVGATNRHKAFDKSISSQTRNADTISYRIRAGQAVNFVAALNISGAVHVRVRMIDETYGPLYERTTDLLPKPRAPDWWQWYFGERDTPTQFVLRDLPSYPTADLYIDITGGANLGVGVILIGQQRTFSLGVRAGARIGIQDYSRKDRNEFGDVMLVERAFSRRSNFSMLLRAAEVDAFQLFLSQVRATACLWIGSDRYESAVIYGFYKSFEIILSYYDYSDCELELEGLT